MTRKGLPGQLDLFDFLKDIQQPEGEVQMVSLMPEEEEAEDARTAIVPEPELEPKTVPEPEVMKVPEQGTESEVVEVPEPELVPKPDVVSASIPEQEPSAEPVLPTEEGLSSDTAPVMHREVRNREGTVIAEISYLNYNKVYIRKGGDAGEIIPFESSKEAVDFYIEEMLKLENLSN